MVTYVLTGTDQTTLKYEYYPEGNQEYSSGSFIIFKTTLAFELLGLAKKDKGNYAAHAIQNILTQLKESKKPPQKGMSAWY